MDSDDLTPIRSILTPQLRKRAAGPTRLQRRLLDAAAARDRMEQASVYLHSLLCQTSLPYRNPGDEVRDWKRVNGNVELRIIAGLAMDPRRGEMVEQGLPFGTKARTMLMHINQRALVSSSPVVEMGSSLTGFVQRVLKLDPGGRNMGIVKDQLARLAGATIWLGQVQDGFALTIKSNIMDRFELWDNGHEKQGQLWPTKIRLSAEYFENLKVHAVPLDELHIGALCHSAMALDIYAWLAQRLHRIPVNQPARVSWHALHGQFGSEYGRLDKFRAIFRVALREVLTVYKAARVEEDARGPIRPVSAALGAPLREPALFGLTLRNSSPPVPPRLFPVCE